MYNSSIDRTFQRKQRVLSKQDLNGLSPQQRQFAQQQFRLIYAQQMSRITSDLSHKKKIQENLYTMDQQQTKNLKQQYQKLKHKMASIQEKRNKNLQDKVKGYKMNDQRWFNKLKQIQNKFKIQNRQAIEKAKKYRQQSENYWKSKEHEREKLAKNNTDNSRAFKYHQDSQHHFNNSFVYQKNKDGKGSKKYVGIGMGKRVTLNHQLLNNNTSRENPANNNMSKTDLDLQIQIHKQKSNNLQKQRETIMFQKAMQKMQKIQQKRAKVTKQKQPKTSEPTKPKVVDQSHKSKSRKKNSSYNNNNNNNKTYNPLLNNSQSPKNHGQKTKSKDSLEKLIKDHLETKQRIQEQQFMQRGQILQNSIQKTRKERILRMIKNKVQQIKVNTIMKESSKVSLLAS